MFDAGVPGVSTHRVTKQLRANLGATTLFLQECLRSPQQIGAILPSSKNLACAMANWLPLEPEAFVLELGPGTRALLERGLRQDRLVAIEKSPRLAGLLRKRFPRAHIITGDAFQLDRLLNEYLHDLYFVGAVISSLPLRNFTPEDANTLARQIRAVLRPGGKWVQYSYNLGNGSPPGTTRFEFLASDVVWWNVPPARVSVYQKPYEPLDAEG
jgi:phosphatidylethanolamine/phosphatidyl-N-methylethanolamine N-methyltransferase